MALMFFRYGNYTHPPGECVPVAFGTSVERNEQGRAIKERRYLSIEVNVIATGDVAINQRVRDIEAAYRQDGGDAALYLTTGDRSHWYLDSGSSLYGVVVEGPVWSCDPTKADWATGLSCTINLSAEYAPLGFVNPFGGITESIEVSGTGGPIYKMDRLDNDKPRFTQIHPASEVYVTQTGEAFNEVVGIAPPQYPSFAPFLFPSNILDPVQHIRQRWLKARERGGKRTYTSSWQYTFTFDSFPFIPKP